MLKSAIKLVIIDDSAFMRKSLSILLGNDPEIEIVGQAKNGLEGFEMVKKLRPDIVTLDIEMPVMDGLTSLKKIMAECPTSVIMISSLTTEGAEATIKAMELGAVDFIPKEMSYVNVNIGAIKEDLIRKIKEIARHRSVRETLSRLSRISSKTDDGKRVGGVVTSSKPLPKIPYKAVALGISTGGPLSLQKVIPKISAAKLRIPFFIVQHMPPKFTKSLADRLNDMSEVAVKEAENNEIVKPGTVYIAPGGFHMTLQKGANTTIKIADQPSNTLHRPSVDIMMGSVVQVYGKYALGVIMTGMGKDGFEAIKELKAIGGYAIAQNEESCIVYGMPKAIVDGGLADSVVSLDKMADSINMVL